MKKAFILDCLLFVLMFTFLCTRARGDVLISGMNMLSVQGRVVAVASHGTNTFYSTGADQYWTNTFLATQLFVKAWGAGGAGGYGAGGAGGYANGYISCTNNEIFTVMVGTGGYAIGVAATVSNRVYGGGAGIYRIVYAAPERYGGGRSAIRRANATEVLTAGGGGVDGENTGGGAGAGGGTNGVDGGGGADAGLGGSQTNGGAGGTGATADGQPGEQYLGGYGVTYFGGGGGGYYGGGGAAHDAGGAGSGGGSAYIGGCTTGNMIAGSGAQPPQTNDANYVTGCASGGVSKLTQDPGGTGGSGLIVIVY